MPMARLISWNAVQARIALPHSTWRFVRTCLPLPNSPPAASVGGGAPPLACPSLCIRLAHFSRAYSHHPGKSPVEASSQKAAPEPVQNRAALQACLCLLVGVYVLWLFILPYAPVIISSLFLLLFCVIPKDPPCPLEKLLYHRGWTLNADGGYQSK
eukprot:c19814_g1_i4 orf=425-892(-)